MWPNAKLIVSSFFEFAQCNQMSKRPFEEIKLSDYHYDLPPERIAQTPLNERDAAKLLVYRQGQVQHSQFRAVSDYLNSDYTVFFNDTKVIPARLFFRRGPTGQEGALIEILLLNPLEPSSLLEKAMTSERYCVWNCMVGNLKKWKDEEILIARLPIGLLKAKIEQREEQTVRFEWEGGQIWSDVLAALGAMPLPPYIKRAANEHDNTQYQTVYNRHAGAVAAPTAGLHFTERVLQNFQKKNITTDFLTLHVSAGTFQPLKASYLPDHAMHSEQIVVYRSNLERLLGGKRVLAVGTTAMRTLESLFWYGNNLCENPSAPFFVEKLQAYQTTKTATTQQAFEAVLKRMDTLKTDVLVGETEIFIFPSYRFQVCKALITNFHLPSTTLVLLVAAFIGKDWRMVYDAAMQNDYRFLSFGDSSLLMPI